MPHLRIGIICRTFEVGSSKLSPSLHYYRKYPGDRAPSAASRYRGPRTDVHARSEVVPPLSPDGDQLG